MKKSKIIGMVLGVIVLGTFFTKNVVMADENEIIPKYPTGVITGEKVIDLSDTNLTVGDIFSKILPYIYTVAGLILLFMLIAGGLGLMTAAGDPKKVEGSQKRITMALVGFLIVFISYLVVQLVEVMLKVDLLGNTHSGATQVEVTKFNSDGEMTSQEIREIESGKILDQEIREIESEPEPDPDAEPCENYSMDDCPSWCSTYDGSCVDN